MLEFVARCPASSCSCVLLLMPSLLYIDDFLSGVAENRRVFGAVPGAMAALAGALTTHAANVGVVQSCASAIRHTCHGACVA